MSVKGDGNRVRNHKAFRDSHEKTFGKKKRSAYPTRRYIGVDLAAGPDQVSIVEVRGRPGSPSFEIANFRSRQ